MALKQSSINRFSRVRGKMRTIYDYGFSRPDDRFIPITSHDLIEMVSGDTETFGDEAVEFRAVAKEIVTVLEQEKSDFERLTAQSYAAFNPDRETISVLDSDGAEQDPAPVLLRLHHMLEKANFERLSEEQVNAALKAGSTHGLRVRLDLDKVADVSIWVRGRSTSKVRTRTLRHPINGVDAEIAIFNRLALVVRLKDESLINVRLFKNIPVRDVDALLPHANVSMDLKDGALMVGSGAFAVWSIVTKLLAVGLATVSQLFWILAIPFAALSWRTFTGYRRARKDRDSHRVRHLYFQNLGANASAIHMLATMICEEEIKEAVLLYAFSRGRAETFSIQAYASGSELDSSIQDYLKQRLDVELDFDMPDAIETMDRLQLWENRDAYEALPPGKAIETLQAHWRQRLTGKYHSELLGIE